MTKNTTMLLMTEFSTCSSNAALLTCVADNEKYYHQPDSPRMQELNTLIIGQENKAEFAQVKMKSERCLACPTVLSCEKKCF